MLFFCTQFYVLDFFKKFLSDDDSKTPSTIVALSFSQQIQKLSDGLNIISIELQSQVRNQHGALLSQATHSGKLDAAVDSIRGHMQRLLAGIDRYKFLPFY